jgi:dUTP pyrophosphatase
MNRTAVPENTSEVSVFPQTSPQLGKERQVKAGPPNLPDDFSPSKPLSKMILPGRSLASKIVQAIRSSTLQIQPCGIDLTLKSVSRWSSYGVVDFDNSRRVKCPTKKLSFSTHHHTDQPAHFSDDESHESQNDFVFLTTGSYLVEFNETVDIPLDLMGQLYVRSSLFRAGALVSAGLMDSGYRGAVGGLLQVVNPHGLRLYRDAKLAQVVFHQMAEPVEGYRGQYQGSKSV